jgi:hypothetical protein
MYLIDIPASTLILEHQYRELTLMRNRGELSEGWYDPATKKKADASAKTRRSPAPESPLTRRRGSPDYGTKARTAPAEDSDDDEFGPALPSQTTVHLAPGTTSFEKRVGPAIPNVQDLEYRDGMY